jgi:hypothetical protein
MTREPPREVGLQRPIMADMSLTRAAQPRQDVSPGKRKKGDREAPRKMTSGTNALPLGKNRYLANNESTASSTVHPPPPQHPPQRYPDLPSLEPPSRRERPQERNIGRRDVYEPVRDLAQPPEPVRYRDQQQPATIYETARRATPVRVLPGPPVSVVSELSQSPQDYSTRVSDPLSRPPHMAEPRREPAADYRSGPSRVSIVIELVCALN